MGKTYGDDGDDGIARLVELVGEQFSAQLSVFVEDIDCSIGRKLQPLIEDIAELKSDMKVVKTAVRATNRDLHKLERRVGRLEVSMTA